MAVAEARAAWQRTVNRCLVQEDAKRAPKLAYCPSASPSIGEVDVGPRSATDAEDIPSVGFLPFNWNTSYSNLSPNTRWWLQLQPSCRQRDFTSEQNSSENSEMKISHIGVGPVVKPQDSCDDRAFVDDSVNTEPFVDSDFRTSNSNVKNDFRIENVDGKPACRGSLFGSVEIDTGGCIASKKTNEMVPFSESPWIGDEKAEPWWRIADQDELALLVAQRSFGLIENCDLPQPQNPRVKREAFVDLSSIDHEEACLSRMNSKHPGYCHGLFTCNENSIASEGECQKQRLPVDYYSQCSASTVTSLREGANQVALLGRDMAESDSSKVELLEALCHSQTRAREAEKAAKEAYEEREHVVKLVFRQASQLFAYKQWFQLLQLENLCHQIKTNKNQPIPSLVPVTLPWVPQRHKKLRKSFQKGARGKRGKKGRPRCDVTKYAVVFALGLSLVGAGLLLGWTVGWMFPTF